MRHYTAYLHKEPDSDYGVSFPDFPGLVTAGETLDDARKMAEEALALHIKGMIEDGEAIPEPSTLDDLANDPDREGAFVTLISLTTPNKLIRFNLTAKENELAAIDLAAEAAGMTRSAYMVHRSMQPDLVGRMERNLKRRTVSAANQQKTEEPVKVKVKTWERTRRVAAKATVKKPVKK